MIPGSCRDFSEWIFPPAVEDASFFIEEMLYRHFPKGGTLYTSADPTHSHAHQPYHIRYLVEQHATTTAGKRSPYCQDWLEVAQNGDTNSSKLLKQAVAFARPLLGKERKFNIVIPGTNKQTSMYAWTIGPPKRDLPVTHDEAPTPEDRIGEAA